MIGSVKVPIGLVGVTGGLRDIGCKILLKKLPEAEALRLGPEEAGLLDLEGEGMIADEVD